MTALVTLARFTCAIHVSHSPSITRADGLFTVERHHIHPLEFDGPNVAANLIYLCPTSHTGVHELLRHMIKNAGVAEWRIRQHYGPAERALAAEGYRRIEAAQLVPVALERVLLAEAA